MPSTLRAGGAVLAASVTFAFSLACATVNVQQSSLVPAPAPPVPVNTERRADMYTAVEAVSVGTQPSLAPNANAGLWIPRTQVEGALSLRVHKRITLRAPYLWALPDGATAAALSTLQNPNQSAYGLGLGLAGRLLGFENPVSLDLSLDVLGVSVPSYVETRDPMTGRLLYSGIQTDTIGLVTLGVATNVRATDWLTFGAVVALRNHPTNVASASDVYSASGAQFGPWVGVIGATTEVRLWSWLSFVGQVNWAVSDYPVRYGPSLVFGVRTPFGDVPETRRPRSTLHPAPGTPDAPQELEPISVGTY